MNRRRALAHLTARLACAPLVGAQGVPPTIILPDYLQGSFPGLMELWGVSVAIAGDVLVGGSQSQILVGSRTATGWQVDQEWTGVHFDETFGFSVGIEGDTIVVGEYAGGTGRASLHTRQAGAFVAAGTLVPKLVRGSTVFAQFWYRDSGDPFGVGLSNGATFGIWP